MKDPTKVNLTIEGLSQKIRVYRNLVKYEFVENKENE